MPASTIALTLTPTSSQLYGHGYDAGTQTLALEFNSNHALKTYHYPGFTPEMYEDMKKAESIGSFFYKHIKAQWDGKFQILYKDVATKHDPLES